MRTCIYCRQSEGPFTREHVIHKGFAPFRNALVIRSAVCKSCNQEFGNGIDLALTRSSAEGLDRYQFGVKNPSEIEKFKYGEVTLRAKDAGAFEDSQFELRSDLSGKQLVARLVPSIAVRRRASEGFVHFTEAEVRDGTWLRNEEVDWRLGIKVLGDRGTLERIVPILKSQGVSPCDWQPLTPPRPGEVSVEQEFQVTTEMQRALAKIAYNYLAYCEGPEYALGGEFDPIRKFIRYGLRPSSSLPPVLSVEGLPFSTIKAGSVLLKDGPTRPVIHFVSLGSNAERNVVGAITLFSFMTHRVMLAEALRSRLPRPRAHLYNIRTKRVFELGIDA